MGNHKELLFDGLIEEYNLVNTSIENHKRIVCKYLEQLNPLKGFVYQNYALVGTKNKEYERLFFLYDTVRNKIE